MAGIWMRAPDGSTYYDPNGDPNAPNALTSGGRGQGGQIADNNEQWQADKDAGLIPESDPNDGAWGADGIYYNHLPDDVARAEEDGPGRTTPNRGPDQGYVDRIQQWYQQYLGRGASSDEVNDWFSRSPDLSGVEDNISQSPEAQARQTPAAGTGGTGGTGGGGDAAWTYGDDAQAAWMAWPGTGTVSEVKAFADAWNKAHPGDLVSLGGSKGEKLTWRGKTYDTVISAGTGGTGKSWQDLSGEGGAGAAGGGTPTTIDDSYLAGYPGGPFEAPAGSDIPPPFQYEDFGPPPEANLPGKFEYADFVGPEKFKQPTAEDLYADPSYQFRKDQAMGALQASASGRGLTNSGGTLNDLLGLSSQFASQEYGNVWDRSFRDWESRFKTALDTYDTNRGNAEHNWLDNLDLGKSAYDQALSLYATNRGNSADTYNSLRTGNADRYTRARDEFDKSVKDYYDNRDGAWEKLYKMSALGSTVTTAP